MMFLFCYLHVVNLLYYDNTTITITQIKEKQENIRLVNNESTIKIASLQIKLSQVEKHINMDTQMEKTLLPFHSPCSILICLQNN